MLFLDPIDSVLLDEEFDAEYQQWLWVLVDTLNENILDIQGAIVSTEAITLATQAVVVDSIYIPTNAAQTVFTLPNQMLVGNTVEIDGQGAGGWKLLTGAGQTIKVASVGGSAGTSITSASRYDSIKIICVVENTTWIVVSAQTTGFVIV